VCGVVVVLERAPFCVGHDSLEVRVCKCGVVGEGMPSCAAYGSIAARVCKCGVVGERMPSCVASGSFEASRVLMSVCGLPGCMRVGTRLCTATPEVSMRVGIYIYT
jgi:hypothetical protein